VKLSTQKNVLKKNLTFTKVWIIFISFSLSELTEREQISDFSFPYFEASGHRANKL
jgi:hypothetical protein